MYSHRLVAFVIFTSLFFTASSLFAGLTWFIVSLRFSNASAGDDVGYGTPKPLPPNENIKKRESPENDETTTAIGAYIPTPRVSRSDDIRQAFQPVMDVASQDEEVYKSRLSSNSSTSIQERNEAASTIIKTEDDLTSLEGDIRDDDTETLER
jgi:hypothetical protein